MQSLGKVSVNKRVVHAHLGLHGIKRYMDNICDMLEAIGVTTVTVSGVFYSSC